MITTTQMVELVKDGWPSDTDALDFKLRLASLIKHVIGESNLPNIGKEQLLIALNNGAFRAAPTAPDVNNPEPAYMVTMSSAGYNLRSRFLVSEILTAPHFQPMRDQDIKLLRCYLVLKLVNAGHSMKDACVAVSRANSAAIKALEAKVHGVSLKDSFSLADVLRAGSYLGFNAGLIEEAWVDAIANQPQIAIQPVVEESMPITTNNPLAGISKTIGIAPRPPGTAALPPIGELTTGELQYDLAKVENGIWQINDASLAGTLTKSFQPLLKLEDVEQFLKEHGNTTASEIGAAHERARDILAGLLNSRELLREVHDNIRADIEALKSDIEAKQAELEKLRATRAWLKEEAVQW